MNSKVKRYWLRSPEEQQEVIRRICKYLEEVGYKERISYHCPRSDRDSNDGFNTILSVKELKELKEVVGFIDIETEKYSITLGSVSVSYFEKRK